MVLTEYARQRDEVYCKCFSSLCLNYFPNKPEEQQVRPTPLGYLHNSRYYQERICATPTPANSQSITFKFSKGYTMVAPDQSQIITVTVYDGSQAYMNVQPTLYLMLPGGETKSYTSPSTQSNGRSSLHLDPISAIHGTRVDYRVCAKELCLDDHFLIWGNS